MNEWETIESVRGSLGLDDRFTEYETAHECHIAGLLVGGGLLASGLFGFLGSSQAASDQLAAEQQALQFQQQVYGQTRNELAPYLQGGIQEWRQLLKNIGTAQHPGILTESPAAFGGLPGAPPAYNYQAPTLSTFQGSPGYKWQLSQGVQAVQDAATGRTGTLGGNTMQALQTYGTGLSNQDWWNFLYNYQNQYNTRYGANTQNYWNRFNAAANQQQNLYNRIAAPAQAGQQAANTMGQQGTAFAGLIGNQLNQIGATNAAGTLGQFGALGGVANSLANPYTQMLLGINNPFSQGGGGSDPYFANSLNQYASGYTPGANSFTSY